MGRRAPAAGRFEPLLRQRYSVVLARDGRTRTEKRLSCARRPLLRCGAYASPRASHLLTLVIARHRQRARAGASCRTISGHSAGHSSRSTVRAGRADGASLATVRTTGYVGRRENNPGSPWRGRDAVPRGGEAAVLACGVLVREGVAATLLGCGFCCSDTLRSIRIS